MFTHRYIVPEVEEVNHALMAWADWYISMRGVSPTLRDFFMARGASAQAEMAGMGEPEGRKEVKGGSQRPAASPGLRRWRKLRRILQAEKRMSATPKPLNMEERVTVLEG